MDSFNAYYQNVHAVHPHVQQHLPSIEWLVSTREEDRRTGRTTALALAFLRDSFSSRTNIKVYDHYISNGMDSRKEICRKIQEMSPGVLIDSDGRMDNQPAYAASRLSPHFGDTLARVRQDFSDVCSSAVKLGVDPEWMMRQLRDAVAESVMSS